MAGNKRNCSSLKEKLTNNVLDSTSRKTYLGVNDFSTKANISVNANFCPVSKKSYKKRKEKSKLKLTESLCLPEVAAQPVNESGSLVKKVSKLIETTKYANPVLRPFESISNFIPSPNRKASGEFAFKRKTNNNTSSASEKTYEGDKCKRKSLNRTSIIRPYKPQSAKNLIDCSDSQKVISYEDQLERNKTTHTLEKEFACDKCKKTFKRNWHLSRHYQTHTNEKPFVCDICGKGFAQKIHLVSHRRTHTGEKPYNCDMCEKRFKRNSHLVAHQRTHTNEKSYVCDICQKRFSQTSNLFTHKRIHTKNMLFGCVLCEKRFKSRRSLMLHRRYHKAGRL